MMKLLRFGCLTTIGVVVLLAVIASVGRSGNSGSSSASSRASSGTRPNTSSAPITYAVGDRITLGDFAYIVHGHRTTTVIGDPKAWGASAGDGAVFVIIEYTIENLTNESRTVLSDDLRILDSQGRRFDSSSKATTALLSQDGQDFVLSELHPGLPKRTKTAFMIPKNATEGELRIVIPQKGLFSSAEAIVILK